VVQALLFCVYIKPTQVKVNNRISRLIRAWLQARRQTWIEVIWIIDRKEEVLKYRSDISLIYSGLGFFWLIFTRKAVKIHIYPIIVETCSTRLGCNDITYNRQSFFGAVMRFCLIYLVTVKNWEQ